jgi:hypothetical protein
LPRTKPYHASLVRAAPRRLVAGATLDSHQTAWFMQSTLNMLSKHMLEFPSATLRDAGEEVVPGGMFLATIAIGMAPAVAAVSFLLGAGLFAVAGSGCLLGAGLITAVVASDR